MENKKCKIIVFEGADGCGKSTQSMILKNTLEQQGYSVYHTRFPSNSLIGNHIRSNMINKINDSYIDLFNMQFACAIEQSLFFKEVELVINELHFYDYIICDRSFLSTMIYSIALGLKNNDINLIKSVLSKINVQIDHLFVLGKNLCGQIKDKKPTDKIEERKDIIDKMLSFYFDEKFIKDNVNVSNLHIIEETKKEDVSKNILSIVTRKESGDM